MCSVELGKRGKPELALIQDWQDHLAGGVKSSILSFSCVYYCCFEYQNILLGFFEIKLVIKDKTHVNCSLYKKKLMMVNHLDVVLF